MYVDWVPVAPAIPTCIAERLAFTITYLCGVIGEQGRSDRASVPFLNLTCLRLRRLCTRLTRLIAAFREGRLAPARVRTRRETPPRPPRKEQLRLPSKFGWLLRFGWQAAGSRSQFEHWLEDPEVQALVAASPQARRILRALCRMFGIPLGPALALPRRKRERRRKP
ncbi:MAG: hypothetical protein JOZ17_12775, partial [Acetobacteraceae bacterium]|nr:hypothetical protein [Acetobacteraceae bacterium]